MRRILRITDLQNDIESHTKDLEILKNRSKNILKSFDEAISQDKFADILRHIFGKRYQQSNSEEIQDSDDNISLCEDSSSGDETGNESFTPLEMQPQGIVDNVCPEGCRQELYELTLKLRSDRHLLEQGIAEKIKEIEEIKKELETNSKKMKSVEVNSKLLQQRYDALQVLCEN
ncbi:uncharacterized protein LOC126278878 [Schistocerca gregaria]|uniref:uncharacterized protein LOC126278878 n=1 Tax=Schistocerca gregaria TaxID=7010 RepID=UPI00211E6569|nr:uncharacterized protein LOC126278878 [Schistocerca gregaria]